MIDIAEVLMGSERTRKYWSDLMKKITEEGHSELSEKTWQLKMKSADGKFYENDCAIPNLRISNRVAQ